MRTPVNMILTAMASCDTVVLFSNLIYTTHYSFVAFKFCHPKHWSYSWALFLIAHAHLSLVAHSSSVWLSVMLALIRYVTLRSRGNMGGMQVTIKHSYYAVAVTISLVAVLNAPNFLNYKINHQPLNETCTELDPKFWNSMAYLPGIADIAKANSCLVFRLSYWISGLVFKLLPCALLSLFVWLLLRILREVRENRQRLLKNSQHRPPSQTTRNGQRLSLTGVAGNEKLGRAGSLRGRGERVDRTTHMLLAIVAVMLMTELPQGIMAVLSGMLSAEFRISIYNNLGDILDLFSLCGSCCSFIIYCSMSGQFRNEFHRVFVPTKLKCLRMNSSSIRRPSDAYSTTKMTFLKVNDKVNGNGNGNGNGNYSEDTRSASVKMVGGQVRRNSTEISRMSETLTPCSPMPASFPSSPLPPIRSGDEESTDETSHLLNNQSGDVARGNFQHV
uniref:G_PROTEIN_RECEP_F1_2 domain-containing protein n=1 Tax=Caenorhabditis japonica TaxID=281687 RepID=A0A8R1HKG5_CAEJA